MREDDRARWTKLVADFESADLSQREFAQERGISLSTPSNRCGDAIADGTPRTQQPERPASRNTPARVKLRRGRSTDCVPSHSAPPPHATPPELAQTTTS
jgi:hypothetical protein